ncbi:(Fe-S)-binding protein [Actinorugispora endophytica]|uniref:Fe-S oxidoreductase n=1 Tax=Actinorugispora endophytica TaxID=1605990 RepID=A0A4V6PWX6_9ACTN|nr:(Fe-S)-binding protein [Actinorugispora endophytica]TDQ55260.1 Fe-S oxidoreductase [Actinorugispora endophytica]
MIHVILGIFTIAFAVVGTVMFAFGIRHIVRTVRLGQPVSDRSGPFTRRLTNMLIETLGHTRMLKWRWIGVAHWFVMVSFGALFFTIVEAFAEVWNPHYELPVIGHWTVYGLAMELIAGLGMIAIIGLAVYRQVKGARRLGRKSRFENSTHWQAYYVEAYILGIYLCIFLIRGFRVAMDDFVYPVWATPLSHALGAVLPPSELGLSVVATVKLVLSFLFFAVIGKLLTMGIGWHRFTAFFNIYFKRNADGSVALGPAKQMLNKDGKPLDFEEADPDEDPFGVGKVEDFTWKGLLDFTTCTECGRCQSQCPAWNTGKPLSPKKLVMDLRDHAYAKAPYLMQGLDEESDESHAGTDVLALLSRPLVGTEEENGVIHPDVLWSCTNCGACVEQCPVDIEHVDHIIDMRRYQVMIESSFPSEANTLLKNLENKGNPWGMSEDKRMDWISEVDFEVPVVEDKLPEGTEYLFWVGCSGALEDRAKKTTKAVAELLHIAGVKFAVLGSMEMCTGDSARRLGMEFVYQMLAQQNIETLNGVGATKIVTTCPHCFNTLGNEYPDLGGDYDVVHHTKLLAELVKENRLAPVERIDKNITYHDPCFLGRHNKVYEPPRELIDGVPGVTNTEMPRNRERSFCCGAGGARMWMEERIGKRINTERVEEALTTRPDMIATGCPFCQVMVSDAVNEKKAKNEAKEELEVMDVAQLLLLSARSDRPEARETV